MRRATSAWLAAAGLWVACSGQEALPVCSGDTRAIARPDTACLESPAGAAFRRGLAERVEPAAGGTRVHVLLGPQAGVARVCADRSPGSSGFSERLRLAEPAGGLRGAAPGPGCMAERRLELNRFGARLGEIDGEMVRCRRQVRRRAEQEPNPGAGLPRRLERDLRDCWQESQREADELWVFDREFENPVPYVRARPDADRRAAIGACARRDVEIGRSAFLETQAVGWRGPEVEACLAEQGWERYR